MIGISTLLTQCHVSSFMVLGELIIMVNGGPRAELPTVSSESECPPVILCIMPRHAPVPRLYPPLNINYAVSLDSP